MRNSISIVLVVTAIIAAFGSTFVNGVAEANAAGLVASTGSAYGLVIALLIGLLGCALKPSNGPSKDEQIEAAFLAAAAEVKAELVAVLDAIETQIIIADLEVNRVINTPKNLGEIEHGLAIMGLNNTFLPPIGTSPHCSRTLIANRNPAWLPPSLGLKA